MCVLFYITKLSKQKELGLDWELIQGNAGAEVFHFNCSLYEHGSVGLPVPTDRGSFVMAHFLSKLA